MAFYKNNSMLHSLESSNSYTENKEYILLEQQIEQATNRTKAVKNGLWAVKGRLGEIARKSEFTVVRNFELKQKTHLN